jgi:hypothetical protein
MIDMDTAKKTRGKLIVLSAACLAVEHLYVDLHIFLMEYILWCYGSIEEK